MKYMGNKTKLLSYIGEAIDSFFFDASSVADPFCGSGAVSWYLASNTIKKVVSGDLQLFATIRASSVVERTHAVRIEVALDEWFSRTNDRIAYILMRLPRKIIRQSLDFGNQVDFIDYVKSCRNFCDSSQMVSDLGLYFTKAYGGYYFSPFQSIVFDCLRSVANSFSRELRNIFISSLIGAASYCSASPGHTAQPFQPTPTACKYIMESWGKDVFSIVKKASLNISALSAKTRGCAVNGDFVRCMDMLQSGDLVIADPPYSSVQYSRFYHVLETLARDTPVTVSGKGRYPSREYRPVSEFSLKKGALLAANRLIQSAASRKLGLLVTFPLEKTSNGLSAEIFIDLGRKFFPLVEWFSVDSSFSTLGGNGSVRKGKIDAHECLICMRF